MVGVLGLAIFFRHCDFPLIPSTTQRSLFFPVLVFQASIKPFSLILTSCTYIYIISFQSLIRGRSLLGTAALTELLALYSLNVHVH